ncbi:LysR family transcriptional regulator [Metabacillus sp. Hm71]|uniref:LysR family transcriptional regulator n=1 Tax=Metabacillus sp. Hm71 TaxID=3450743 RepID=UPI003F43CDEF
MELRVLRYFLTVAREENISRAADILHITQPTLSRQLMQLEEELGTQLFLRGKRRVTLTEDGVLLSQRAEEILTLMDNIERDVGQNHISGTISIGSVESILASQILSNLIKTFHLKYSQVKFNLYTGNANDIREKIDKGLLDIGLLLTPVNIEKYDSIRLPQQERWGILMPNNAVLSKKEYVTPEDVVGLPLIIPNRPVVQQEIAGWFGNHYDNLQIFATYNLIYNAAALVQQHLGYAICLESVMEIRGIENTCFRPFSPEYTSSCLFIWKNTKVFTPTTARFIQFMKDTYETDKHY